MWYSSVSLILTIAIGMQRFQGVLLTTISFDSEDLEKNVVLSFENPMDDCDDPNNEDVVRLKQMSLTIVPKDFLKSSNVRFITLEGNEIKNISVDAFRSVPNLICLNIRNNRIDENFLRNFRHDNLVQLNLANNEIAFNSDVQWNAFLPRLTHLDLSRNSMKRLPSPEIFQSSFPNLTHFYFSHNLLIQNLYNYLPPSTKHIYLEGCYGGLNMDYFPSYLSTLYINNNKIIHYGSYESPHLTILSMRRVTNLRYVIENINVPNLIDLDLSFNELDIVLTNWFKYKNSVRRLSLENNKFSDFPVLNELRSLTDLSLNFNYITNITAESIADHKYLERLYLRGNRISMIEQDAFSKLNYLERLDLSKNQLTTLPASWILPLTALTHLDLRSNLFDIIDDMSVNVYMKSLKHLYLGKNNFTRIQMSNVEEIHPNAIIHVL